MFIKEDLNIIDREYFVVLHEGSVHTILKSRMVGHISPSASSDFSIDDSEDLLTIRMVHEFAHFADVFYENATDSDKWKKLYAEYKDEYVEFGFYGIDRNTENQFDIDYATSNRYEFFACSMKDFYCH